MPLFICNIHLFPRLGNRKLQEVMEIFLGVRTREGYWEKFGMGENDNGKQLLTNQYQKKKQNMLRIVPTKH
jgi:hypothetical protein